jgi:hypothetical protein
MAAGGLAGAILGTSSCIEQRSNLGNVLRTQPTRLQLGASRDGYEDQVVDVQFPGDVTQVDLALEPLQPEGSFADSEGPDRPRSTTTLTAAAEVSAPRVEQSVPENHVPLMTNRQRTADSTDSHPRYPLLTAGAALVIVGYFGPLFSAYLLGGALISNGGSATNFSAGDLALWVVPFVGPLAFANGHGGDLSVAAALSAVQGAGAGLIVASLLAPERGSHGGTASISSSDALLNAGLGTFLIAYGMPLGVFGAFQAMGTAPSDPKGAPSSWLIPFVSPLMNAKPGNFLAYSIYTEAMEVIGAGLLVGAFFVDDDSDSRVVVLPYASPRGSGLSVSGAF